MPAYLIADEIEVSDAQAMARYGAAAGTVVQKYKGRLVAASDQAQALEGSWLPGRIVMVEFPDMAALRSFYESAEYTELKAVRQGASRSNLIAVEGGDGAVSMKAFVIADVRSVHDPEAMKPYGEGVGPTIADHNGRVLAGAAAQVLEGDWTPGRVIIGEFPDIDGLRDWYYSDEYQRLVTIRQAASSVNMIAVPGI